MDVKSRKHQIDIVVGRRLKRQLKQLGYDLDRAAWAAVKESFKNAALIGGYGVRQHALDCVGRFTPSHSVITSRGVSEVLGYDESTPSNS